MDLPNDLRVSKTSTTNVQAQSSTIHFLLFMGLMSALVLAALCLYGLTSYFEASPWLLSTSAKASFSLAVLIAGLVREFSFRQALKLSPIRQLRQSDRKDVTFLLMAMSIVQVWMAGVSI